MPELSSIYAYTHPSPHLMCEPVGCDIVPRTCVHTFSAFVHEVARASAINQMILSISSFLWGQVSIRSFLWGQSRKGLFPPSCLLSCLHIPKSQAREEVISPLMSSLTPSYTPSCPLWCQARKGLHTQLPAGLHRLFPPGVMLWILRWAERHRAWG